MNQGTRRILFLTFACLFVLAALHHAYEYFDSSLRPDYPPSRHLVFMAINLVIAFFMVRRTKLMVPILIVVSIQQLYGHGGNLIASINTGASPLYTDWVVVVLIPPLLVMYIYDTWGGNDGN